MFISLHSEGNLVAERLLRKPLKMLSAKCLIILNILHVCFCDWVAEWMTPVQEQLQKGASRRVIDEEVVKMVDLPDPPKGVVSPPSDPAQSATNLKAKLEETLANAEDLVEKLQMQIAILERKEQILKEAIANGRTGVSTVTVNTMYAPARTYIIRDGSWALCNGMVQYPTGGAPDSNLFSELFASPRCIGQEVVSKQDPCVYNSIIKYEVVPNHRQIEYAEEDMLCLRPSFNNTLEQYRSVPRHIINTTCTDGVVRSLNDNLKQCGLRTLADYTYYPHRSSLASLLPLEYCTEKDGSCKLVMAWHLSNNLVENLAFFKPENVFKKLFMKPPSGGPFIEHII